MYVGSFKRKKERERKGESGGSAIPEKSFEEIRKLVRIVFQVITLRITFAGETTGRN